MVVVVLVVVGHDISPKNLMLLPGFLNRRYHAEHVAY
jgi:hypothetical protein